MAIEKYIGTHRTFTSDDLLDACGRSQTNRNLLSRAVKGGRVIRVGRGVYCSSTGRYEGMGPDPYQVAEKATDGCIFSYGTALLLLGAAHNVPSGIVQAYGSKGETWSACGTRYVMYAATPQIQKVLTNDDRWVTEPCRTFVDCVARPSRAGGAENVCRSLPMLDVYPEECLRIADGVSRSAYAKVALMLDVLGALDGRDDLRREAARRCASVRTRFGDGPDVRYYGPWNVMAPAGLELWVGE